MVYFPCLHVTGHIPFASRATVNIRFFRHNAILHRKLVPTHRSMVYFPCFHVTGHIPFASRANVNIRFFRHNAILHGKLVPTDRSMVYFPCLHVTGHIPFASRANVNIRFFRHNAVLHGKLVPTHRSMVYFPCLHVTGHIPIASRANVNIRFFRHNASFTENGSHRPSDGLFALSSRHWPHSLCKRGKYKHTLSQRPARPIPGNAYHMRAGDLPGPCVYCSSQTFGKRDKYIGNSCLSSLLCFICQQRHRLRRAAIVLLFAAPFCLPVCASFCSVVFSTLLRVRRGFLQLGDILVSFLFSFHAGSPDISRRLPAPLPSSGVVVFTTYTYRPFCSDFCSVLLSPMFCLRLCFLRLAALLFSSPFSFRDGIPDIGNGACRFFFRFLPGDFRLRCSDPLYCFAELPREMT